MFSTPLICSSSGVATASASARGLAPGYTARTTIAGGASSGYSLMGSSTIAMRPAMKITMDSTPARIGRSMKRLEKRMRDVSALTIRGDRRRGNGVRHHRGFGGGHLHAGADTLQPVDHDALTGLETVRHHAQ